MEKAEKVFDIRKLKEEALRKVIGCAFDHFLRVEFEVVWVWSDEDEYEYMEMEEIFFYYNKYDYLIVEINKEINFESYKPYELIGEILIQLENGKFSDYKASPAEIYLYNLIEKYQCKEIYIGDDKLLMNYGMKSIHLRDAKSIVFNKDETKIIIIDKDYKKFIVDFDSDTFECVGEML